LNDNFEFILGMYSIIAGLGVSRLLEGIRMATQPGSTMRGYWVHVVMAGLGLMVQATTWLSLWALRHVEVWTFRGFLSVLTVPALLYLYSASVLPTMDNPGYSDLTPKQRYFVIARRIHGLLAAAMLVYTLSEWIVSGRFQNIPLTLMRLVLTALLGACALWQHEERLHRIVVPLLAVIGLLMPVVLDMEAVEG
jgi:hypothetical protein